VSYHLKKGIKIIGIACSSFNREVDRTVTIIGAVFRGGELLEGVIKTTVTVDGDDATENIINMIKKSTHWQQLKLIMTRGVTIAGFNYLDLKAIFEQTTLPVISIVDREPSMEKISAALKNIPNGEKRLKIIETSGIPRAVYSAPKEEPVYIQNFGIETNEVIHLLQKTTKVGRLPEPLRVARLIAIAEER